MKIGFIGMGVMGLPMAINLVNKSKLSVIGFDVVEEKRKEFEEKGGMSTDNIDVIIEDSNIIFICLPTNELVEFYIEKILKNSKIDTLIVDLGSTAPNVIRKMYLRCKETGIGLVDSPVSGGELGAIDGTLAIMSGGDKEVFEKVRPLLQYMGTTVTYMGTTGCGAVAKLANNMIVGCNIGAISEALAFAVKAGLNPETLFNAIRGGFAGSAVLDCKAPKIISRDFKASARIAVHQKDLKNALQLAKELDIEIPLSKMIFDYMNELEQDGMLNDDQCAIARIYEKRMGVIIK